MRMYAFCSILCRFLLVVGFCLLICAKPNCYAQTKIHLDSLKNAFRKANIQNYASILYKMGDFYRHTDFETGRRIAEDHLQTAKSLPFKNALPHALRNLGILYGANRQTFEALDYYKQAYETAKEYNLSFEMAHSAYYLGGLYYSLNRLDYALEHYLEAIEVFEKNGYQYLTAQILFQIGTIHYQNRDDRVIEFLQKALAVGQDSLPMYLKINALNTMGLFEERNDNLTGALTYLQKAQDLAWQVQDTTWVGLTSGNMGAIFAKQNNYPKAIELLKIDIEISQKRKLWTSAGNAWLTLANIYTDQKLFEKAQMAYDSAALLLELDNNPEQSMLKLYESLGKYYNQIKRFDKAYQSQTLYTSLLLEWQTKQDRVQLFKVQAAYDFDKKQTEIELLRKNNLISQATIQRQNTITAAVVAVLITIGILLIYMYRSNRKIQGINSLLTQQQNQILGQNIELQKKQEEISAQRDFIELKNTELSDINTHINNSIKAAQTIQEAILPQESDLQRILGDHFLFYQPKDIVSGDFYWLRELDKKVHEDSQLIRMVAVVDCTGHGIPGAFMSMIGSTLLDRVTQRKAINSPSQVLEKMHEEVTIALKQHKTGNTEGMDMGLIFLEKMNENQIKIVFSGAKRSMCYVPKNAQEVVEIKGERKSIGGHSKNFKIFANTEIILPKGSLIYMFSDGYEDQNNAERIRFGSRRLIELLGEINHLPLTTQKDILQEKLKKHMENSFQRDDILVLGFRI